ncbi:MAG: reverse transcriptase domain-containing protein, partial [Legionella sp.]|nr:reverse transcriptase domain-containing protein [Legionella sp.]
KLFNFATEQSSLRSAWHRIRSNGLTSSSPETRVAIEMFGREESRNIFNMQRRLRDGTFEFEPQKGVLKKKSSGGKRGIVMASVHNRIVERSWLDCLQQKSGFVRKVIDQPTSVGGVPNRSVPHGLRLIRDAFSAGKTHYVRSDISGFFDHIPRSSVIEKIACDVDDEKFLKTLTTATAVVLANEDALGEDRRVFPTGDEGVAQGSPLSPLFGNILLYNFDLQFNDRGIICVRFIDDFVLLGDNERDVNKAFLSAKKELKALGLNCHDPYGVSVSIEKAAFGPVEQGFVFLGYDIRPGLYQPSRLARQKLDSAVEGHIYLGRQSILDVKAAANSFESRRRYVQTLELLDKVLRGWAEAFAYGNSPSTIEDIDRKIDFRLNGFRQWFARQLVGQDWKTRRRLGGVCLLGDVKTKSLDDVPFILDPARRFVHTSNAVTISTDGSIAVLSKKKGKDQGPGGWAFVVHGSGEERGGNTQSATNNQMELRAVIEAIRFVDSKKSLIIRTDSQYVCDAINRQNTVKSNAELWSEYREVSKSRRIKVVWIK